MTGCSALVHQPGSLWVPKPAVKWLRNRKNPFPPPLRCSPPAHCLKTAQITENKLQCLQAMGYWTASRLHQGLCCHPGTTYWEQALHFHEDSQTRYCPIPQAHRRQVTEAAPPITHETSPSHREKMTPPLPQLFSIHTVTAPAPH